MLEIVPMTLREANAFVEQNHRHHGATVGHKTVNGTYTVKYYYPGRKCGVHIDGLGWVPESGCTVIG